MMAALGFLCWWIWPYFTLYRGSTQCYCWHIFRHSRKDVPLTSVGKKAAYIVSNSESNNEIESLGSSLTDKKEILECLLNLPCLSYNTNRTRKHTKCSKVLRNNGTTYCCYSNVEHCYLNLPEDMVEDNHLYIENIKEKQDKDNDFSQSSARHPTWYSYKIISVYFKWFVVIGIGT